jgi:hypothetical protein
VKLVATEVLDALQANLVMGNLVNRNYEPMLAQVGDTVNVPLPPTMVANDLTRGGSVVTQASNLGNAQIVLNKHKEATFAIPDVTRAFAAPDLIKAYLEPAIIAMAEAIEGDLLSLYSGFTSNTILGSGGTALTEAVVDAAETNLFKAKVPAIVPKYMVVNPDAYSQLRQIPRFSESDKVDTGNAIISGQIGRLKEFTIFRSQLVKQTGSGPIQTNNIAFAKDAIALVMRRMPQPLPGTGAVAEYAELGNFGVRVTMSYQPNTLSQQFSVDALYGVGVLRNEFGQQVRS